jgi:enoyl-CoA hydratase/carnithine racemase
MIHGAHVIIYSKDADADRVFIRDVLGFTHVDVGGGWLIFGLPPAEVAVHPTDGGGSHELFLMCDDVEKFRAEMAGHGVPTGALQEQRWGVITDVALPSGAKLSVYEPRHVRPEPMNRAPATTKARAKKASAKPPAKAKGKPPAKSKSKPPAKAKGKPSAKAKQPTKASAKRRR